MCSGPLTRLHVYNLKVSHSKEHANPLVPCHTGVRLPARIRLHVSALTPNHTPHNSETVMPRAHLYKGELASPSSHLSFHRNRRFAAAPEAVTDHWSTLHNKKICHYQRTKSVYRCKKPWVILVTHDLPRVTRPWENGSSVTLLTAIKALCTYRRPHHG
ncbi:hypothetical protein MtrunA17_Chr1g0172901 [Medicago truncatula]|uniref:Uncharacterized protein n=1 Tax=Medicago truncatula TaxID=3880 RepID=A0A072VIW4_MEDTR|nr:hypothetical protein MTR_1g052210 [Medicago truncatula]RHN79070.1 hypothetical protein MtrunA17_Chr1g0172901 [Medicago truncatula]